MTATILVSGGAGYIGSHAAYSLQKAGYTPVVIDNLATGHGWAVKFGAFEKGDIGDADFVRRICEQYKPAAALHFAAFIEVGESVQNPAKYFDNNREKASRFFSTLSSCGIKKTVFSSTAAVYGEISGDAPIAETLATKPINPYGQSKLDAETYLRTLDSDSMRSVTLRYFNVAGAAPGEAGIGEAHRPESHLIPRLLLPLIAAESPYRLREGLGVGRETATHPASGGLLHESPPPAPPASGRGVVDPSWQSVLRQLGLDKGFTVYGNDYPTPDGTAIRDYIHVMDLIDAHIHALDYLLKGGVTNIFNLGCGKGFSVQEIVEAVRKALNRPDFVPGIAPRREGDPAILVASNAKASQVLGWKPKRALETIIGDAIAWHRSSRYREAVGGKAAA